MSDVSTEQAAALSKPWEVFETAETVADVRKFLRRASKVTLFVQTDARRNRYLPLTVPKSAIVAALKDKRPDERLPARLDADNWLWIGI